MVQKHTDIVKISWVERLPAALKPYFYLMRLDRPIGTWLLLLPAWWSMILAGAGLHEWPVFALFAVGAIIMRGAGCVVNDLWDRDLDKQVERTAARPLPHGDITPRHAIIFLGCLLFAGLCILLHLPPITITLGIISVVFIALYPLMKRITWWPQAFLGLTFNFGALMGWATITGDLAWQAWALYAAGFFWTLGYDTIYALQDRKDDALIGIKSTARLFTERWKGHIKIPLSMFYGLHVMCLIVALSPWGWSAAFLITLPAIHLIWQVATLSLSDPQNALIRFQSNRDYGLLLCGIFILCGNFL